MLIILAVLCLIWFLVIISYQLKQVAYQKDIKLINFANLMFAFVYGLLPAVILFRELVHTGSGNIDISKAGILKLFIILIVSVFVHFFLNMAYKGTKSVTRAPVTAKATTFRASFLMLAFGFVFLFLWTRAAGGIFAFIEIAPGIRGRYTELKNPFAFLQHFTKILILAACILTSYWLQNKKKLWVIAPAGLALYGAFLFAMAWDSRATFGFIFLMIALVYIEYSIQEKKTRLKKLILPVLLVAVGTLIVMVFSEGLAQSIRGNSYENEASSNIFTIITSEFGYVLRVQQKMVQKVLDADYQMQILNDLLNAATAWIPTRFIPFKTPQNMWTYNTLTIMGGTKYATVPTDFISACLLEMGVLGLIVFPIIMGWLLKKADNMVASKGYNFYRSNIKAALAILVINQISHFQLSSIASSLFYVFLGHVIIVMCRVFENGGKVYIGSAPRLEQSCGGE